MASAQDIYLFIIRSEGFFLKEMLTEKTLLIIFSCLFIALISKFHYLAIAKNNLVVTQ